MSPVKVLSLPKERRELTITSIYGSIQPQIVQVKQRLKKMTEAAPLEMSDQLDHVLEGGKIVRSALTLLAGKFYNYNLELLVPMASAIELLHTATLVHDDTVDKAEFRRSKPTLNHLWGNHYAVLIGDYLFAASAQMTAETENIRVMKLFARTLMDICSGELDESLSPFDQSRERYFRRIDKKTACLFSAAAESGAVLSEAPEETVQRLREYGYNIGMSFQIVDDILDFTSQGETLGKPVSNDLSQGIFTLPTILLLERPEVDSIKGVFEEDKDRGKKLLMEMVYKSDVLNECYDVVKDFCSKAKLAIEPLPRNDTYDSLISLADYIITRER
ncbi:polyprenyl synthetase family protein [Chloroflexota bacterium]